MDGKPNFKRLLRITIFPATFLIVGLAVTLAYAYVGGPHSVGALRSWVLLCLITGPMIVFYVQRHLRIIWAVQMKIEEELKRGISQRDEFLSIASHELRTPVTSLKLNGQLMNKKLAANEPVKTSDLQKFFAVFNRQTDRMARLIDEMLDVSRLNVGKLQIKHESVDLSKIVTDVVDKYADQFTESGCKIETKLTSDVVGMWDDFRIEQVVTNLVHNACKYGKGKPIVIETAKRHSEAVLNVTDYGAGIPAEDQQRIFERFERASGTENIGGLGLGLYISREIVLSHHGVISVQNEPGRGATFTVVLPIS